MTYAASRAVAAQVFRNPRFLVPCILVRQSDGTRNEHGEFVAGATSRADVRAWTAPVDGHERQQLPEGVRSKNLRKFWLKENVSPVVEGKSDGDVIEHEGVAYRATMVQNWGSFSEVVGVARDG